VSISLGIASAGPSWRAQRLLTLARPYVDEIVLAGGAEVIDACTGLADRTLALEPGADRGRAAELLREACAGEWLLCCEDGEVPSRALLKALRELGSERRLTHYVLTTRWLYRDQASCLRSPPWQPDYRPRIVRRGAPAAGERRLLDLPLYRAELLLVAEEERRVRAWRSSDWRPMSCTTAHRRGRCCCRRTGTGSSSRTSRCATSRRWPTCSTRGLSHRARAGAARGRRTLEALPRALGKAVPEGRRTSPPPAVGPLPRRPRSLSCGR